jgi:hypothetical protein
MPRENIGVSLSRELRRCAFRVPPVSEMSRKLIERLSAVE